MVDESRKPLKIDRSTLGTRLGDVTKQVPAESREIRKVEKVEVVQKETVAKKTVTRFFGGDPKDVAMYTLRDVLLPALKETLLDIICKGSERLIMGDNAPSNRNFRRHNGRIDQYISYNSMYDGPSRLNVNRARSRYDFADILIDSRPKAEDILSRMNDLLDNYGVVRVSDFYNEVGVTGVYTDQNWGWTDLRGSSVRQVRGGWVIEMPQAKDIRNVQRR